MELNQTTLAAEIRSARSAARNDSERSLIALLALNMVDTFGFDKYSFMTSCGFHMTAPN